MSARNLKRFRKTDGAAEKLLEAARTKLGLSARAYTRILKVSHTIADLDGLPEVTAAQVAEAIQMTAIRFVRRDGRLSKLGSLITAIRRRTVPAPNS